MECRLGKLDVLHDLLTRYLLTFQLFLVDRRIDQSEFYAIEQWCNYNLELLDKEIAECKYDLNQLKRGDA
jgi:hypothetical protein